MWPAMPKVFTICPVTESLPTPTLLHKGILSLSLN